MLQGPAAGLAAHAQTAFCLEAAPLKTTITIWYIHHVLRQFRAIPPTLRQRMGSSHQAFSNATAATAAGMPRSGAAPNDPEDGGR